MSPKKTTLVTGANGFIGGWLVESLYLMQFSEVRAGIRNWSSAVRVGRFPVEIVPCDVMDQEQVSRAMNGVSHVIHCASGSSDVIVRGTQQMLDAAQKAKVERFVYLSSAEVYGSASGRIEETFRCDAAGNPYGDAKREAERLCDEHSRKGVPVTIVRPSIVYGPFSKDWTVRLALSLQSGNWGIFNGYGEGKCNLIYIADLVCGILSAMNREAAIGEAFNLVGPEVITWNDYFQRFNAALGLPELRTVDPKSARVRVGILEPTRIFAKFLLAHFGRPLKGISQRSGQARAIMKSFEKTIKTCPRLEDLNLYDRDALYVTRKAEQVLGFQPRFGVSQGLELTCGWLRQVGLAN